MRMRWAWAMVVCLEGCGSAAPRGAATPANFASHGEAESMGAPQAASDAAPQQAPAAAPPPAMRQMNAGFSGAPVPAAAPAPVSAEAHRPVKADMLDIEANIAIEVDSVPAAANELRRAARNFDGVVVEDTMNEQPNGATARLTIRVPTPRAEKFLEALDGVGRTRSRQVNARDIGKEYFDAELKVENLQATMKRYEDILKQAKDVNEILRVENELSRLRAEIEQTKGNLRWLGDRAARATIHVNLSMPPREIAASPPPEHAPEAKLYPGISFTELTDFRGERGNTAYLGAGLSATFSRHIALHVFGLRESGTGSPTRGLDVMLFTIGGEMYSEFLGGGKRKFLNPYLGYTLGYARFTGNGEGLIGITAGVEILKTKTFTLDAEARAFGLLFGSEGSHAAVQPVLRASIAF
jgi:hypothetical protein